MTHLSEGALRRLHDDSYAISESEHEHLDGCARCRAHAQEAAAAARTAESLFALEVVPAEGTEAALRRVRARLAEQTTGVRTRWQLPRPRLQPSRRLVLAGAALPVVLIGLLVTASASGWFTIFQPQQFAAVTVSTKELTGLPDLSSFGHMKVDRPTASDAPNGAAAARAAGLAPLQIPALPANIPADVHWASVGRSTASFTFDQAAARRAAAQAGRPAPSFPPGIDGSTVSIAGGPGAVALYGAGSTSSAASMPTLVIAEARIPTVSTDGVSLAQLKDFLLAQPGISPQLALQIRAIGDPASTLPVPVLVGRMSARSVTIGAAQGLVVGDNTGLGAGVVWQRDGVVYAVGGQLAETEVVQIARSLH